MPGDWKDLHTNEEKFFCVGLLHIFGFLADLLSLHLCTNIFYGARFMGVVNSDSSRDRRVRCKKSFPAWYFFFFF